MMPEISIKAKPSQRYANHSVRATPISAMDNAGVEARHNMRASGHRSKSSIRTIQKDWAKINSEKYQIVWIVRFKLSQQKTWIHHHYLDSVQQKLKLYYLIQKLFLKKFRQILTLQHVQIRMTFALLVCKIRRTYMHLHLYLTNNFSCCWLLHVMLSCFSLLKIVNKYLSFYMQEYKYVCHSSAGWLRVLGSSKITELNLNFGV